MIQRSVIVVVGLLAAMCLAVAAGGQTETAREYATDFAVPDAPAFQLIDTAGSQLLRPASVREFAVALSDVLESDQPVALEVAPLMMLRQKGMSLNEYRAHQGWYRLRVSLATRGPLGAPNALAVGLRLTPRDDADLRGNANATKQAQWLADTINAIVTTVKRTAGPFASVDSIRALPEVRMLTEPLERAFREQVIDEWEATSWNANATSIAFALMWESADTTSEHLKFSQAAAWYTQSRGWGKWGQLLIGASGKAIRKSLSEDNYKFELATSGRLYAGYNQAKLLTEAQLWIVEDENLNFALSGGGETRFRDGFWVELTFGVQYTEGGDETSFVSNFKLKLGL